MMSLEEKLDKLLDRPAGTGSAEDAQVNLLTMDDDELDAQQGVARNSRMSSAVARKFQPELLGDQTETKEIEHLAHDRVLRGRLSLSGRETLRIHRFVLYPHSNFRLSWDLVSCLLICFGSVTLPYRIAFIDKWTVGWQVFDFLVDCFFILDIVVNARTMVLLRRDGKLLMTPRGILQHYARSWLALDLLSSIPFDWFRAGPFPDENDPQLKQLIRTVRLLKLLRLLRLSSLLRIVAKWEERRHILGMNMRRLLGLIFFICLFSHWNACLSFFLSGFDTIVDPITGSPVLHPDTWVRRANLDAMPPLLKWSWSFYQAMTQLLTISIGVAEPERPTELWLYLLSMVVGAALHAIFVASLTAVFTEIGAAGREYRSKIDMLHQYMRDLKMPHPLRRKLQAYFEFCFPDRRMFNEGDIIDRLSHPLRSEIALLKCREVLSALHVSHDASLCRRLALMLERTVFVDGDYVIFENDIGRGMYFISSGAVDVYVQGMTTPMATLGRRSFFGEMALLEPKGKSKGNVVVRHFMEGYFLSKSNFDELLTTFPEFKTSVLNVARMRMEKIETDVWFQPSRASRRSSSDSKGRSSFVRRFSLSRSNSADDDAPPKESRRFSLRRFSLSGSSGSASKQDGTEDGNDGMDAKDGGAAAAAATATGADSSLAA